MSSSQVNGRVKAMHEEFRAIRLDELDECLDLWGSVFERVGRDYFLAYIHGDPWFKLDYTRVCVADGKIVSAVQICRRDVGFGISHLKMGGIANVATLPEYRGRGYSSRLLKDCIWVMQSHGIGFSMLFTGIQHFYERIGWRSVPVSHITGRLRSHIRALPSRTYSIRHRVPEDIIGMKDVYAAFNATRPLAVRRNQQYWEGYVRSRLGNSENIFVAVRNGSLVGYIYAPPAKDTFRIHEIAYTPGDEGCVYPLVAHAAAQAKKMGAQTAWYNIPHEPAIVSAVKRVTEELESDDSRALMCRLIDTRVLLNRILPELNRRASYFVLPRAEISLETEFGSLGFTFENQSVYPETRNPIRVKLSQEQFFSLLFGLKTINEMDISVPFEAFQVLSALFGRQRAVFWGLDSF